MADLEQPRPAATVQHHVKAEHLEAREAWVVVAQQRVVGVAQVGLDGEQALHEQRSDLRPDLVGVVAGLRGV